MVATTVWAFIDTAGAISMALSGVDEPEGVPSVCFAGKTALAAAHALFFFRGAE